MKYDLYGKTLPLLFLGGFQACFWLPHLRIPPWFLPWLFALGQIDLATVTDFVPAVVMVLAGCLTALAGIQRGKNRFVEISIFFQTLAIATVVMMDVAVPELAHIVVSGSFGNGL